MTPEGLHYVNSWVASDMRRCYQVMETQDPTLLEQWMEQWHDIINFQVVPVLSSSEAASAVARPSAA